MMFCPHLMTKCMKIIYSVLGEQENWNIDLTVENLIIIQTFWT